MVLFDQRNVLVDLAERISLKEVRRGRRGQRGQENVARREGKQERDEQSGGPEASMQSSGRLTWPTVRSRLTSFVHSLLQILDFSGFMIG